MLMLNTLIQSERDTIYNYQTKASSEDIEMHS